MAEQRAKAITNKIDGCATARDEMTLRTWKAEREQFREKCPQDRKSIEKVLGL